MKGFVIAGTNSGCGKTTVTLAFLSYLSRKGFNVAPFKVGPDFIDPGHHTKITGKQSRNLDGWMLSKETNINCFYQNSIDADIAVVEGVMGLFDGYDGKTEAGSTAQMAKWIDLPVILVVNAQSMARSAAALVQGYENFDKDLNFAGVIFNKLGSKNHLNYITDALEGNVKMPCLGGILRDDFIAMPERHLGLVTQDDYILSDEAINKLADIIEQNIDINRLFKNVSCKEKQITYAPKPLKTNDKKVTIGVARDNAFCFYYQENLEILEENGAEIIFFSPIKDKILPDNIDGIYFGGGYPELFAKQLAEQTDLRNSIKKLSKQGMPIYAECGGFMYLCSALYDKDEVEWPMTGILPYTTAMLTRLKSLGYREVVLSQDTILGKKGDVIRGHEFHYSKVTDFEKFTDIDTVYKVSTRTGLDKDKEGYIKNRTLGSYIHLHFASYPDVGKNFVQACLQYKKEKEKIL